MRQLRLPDSVTKTQSTTIVLAIALKNIGNGDFKLEIYANPAVLGCSFAMLTSRDFILSICFLSSSALSFISAWRPITELLDWFFAIRLSKFLRSSSILMEIHIDSSNPSACFSSKTLPVNVCPV